MFNNNNNSYGKFISLLQNLTEADLERFANQARSLGMSEQVISQGMSMISSLKNQNKHGQSS